MIYKYVWINFTTPSLSAHLPRSKVAGKIHTFLRDKNENETIFHVVCDIVSREIKGISTAVKVSGLYLGLMWIILSGIVRERRD